MLQLEKERQKKKGKKEEKQRQTRGFMAQLLCQDRLQV